MTQSEIEKAAEDFRVPPNALPPRTKAEQDILFAYMRGRKQGFLAGAEHTGARWISVKDRLPENGVFVLVYIDLPWCYRVAARDGDRWIVAGNGFTYEVPTYWTRLLPLPPAPEAEK